MTTIDEELQAREVGWDMLDGFTINVANVELYLKKLIVWILVLVLVVLVLRLGRIFIGKFFALTSKDESDRVMIKLFNALDSETREGLIVVWEPDRLSSTSTITPNGST